MKKILIPTMIFFLMSCTMLVDSKKNIKDNQSGKQSTSGENYLRDHTPALTTNGHKNDDLITVEERPLERLSFPLSNNTLSRPVGIMNSKGVLEIVTPEMYNEICKQLENIDKASHTMSTGDLLKITLYTPDNKPAMTINNVTLVDLQKVYKNVYDKINSGNFIDLSNTSNIPVSRISRSVIGQNTRAAVNDETIFNASLWNAVVDIKQLPGGSVTSYFEQDFPTINLEASSNSEDKKGFEELIKNLKNEVNKSNLQASTKDAINKEIDKSKDKIAKNIDTCANLEDSACPTMTGVFSGVGTGLMMTGEPISMIIGTIMNLISAFIDGLVRIRYKDFKAHIEVRLRNLDTDQVPLANYIPKTDKDNNNPESLLNIIRRYALVRHTPIYGRSVPIYVNESNYLNIDLIRLIDGNGGSNAAEVMQQVKQDISYTEYKTGFLGYGRYSNNIIVTNHYEIPTGKFIYNLTSSDFYRDVLNLADIGTAYWFFVNKREDMKEIKRDTDKLQIRKTLIDYVKGVMPDEYVTVDGVAKKSLMDDEQILMSVVVLKTKPRFDHEFTNKFEMHLDYIDTFICSNGRPLLNFNDANQCNSKKLITGYNIVMTEAEVSDLLGLSDISQSLTDLFSSDNGEYYTSKYLEYFRPRQ